MSNGRVVRLNLLRKKAFDMGLQKYYSNFRTFRIAEKNIIQVNNILRLTASH